MKLLNAENKFDVSFVRSPHSSSKAIVNYLESNAKAGAHYWLMLSAYATFFDILMLFIILFLLLWRKFLIHFMEQAPNFNEKYVEITNLG